MALAVPTSSATTTTASCLSPQLPLISLRETVAKINMPTVVQASAINNQVSSSAVSNEPVYNLTISNGEIIHSSTTSGVPKIAVPSVAALAVSGMPGMAGKHLTSATNVLTGPLISAPVHMVTQHFTTEKIPSSNIVTLPTIPRMTTNGNTLLTAKPRQTPLLTPLLSGGLITSKGQIVIASANNPLIASSSIMTTMSTISLNSSIVTVTPVIMTSTAPLVSLSGNVNSTMTLNPGSQAAQVLSNISQQNCKPIFTTGAKTFVPTAYLKPMSLTGSPTFPVAVQPATITPNTITIASVPPPNIIENPVQPLCVSQPPTTQCVPMPPQCITQLAPQCVTQSLPLQCVPQTPSQCLPQPPPSQCVPQPALSQCLSQPSPQCVLQPPPSSQCVSQPAPSLQCVSQPLLPQCGSQPPPSQCVPPHPPQELNREVKNDHKPAEFDPINLLDWKDGVAELPGSDLKFRMTEFGTLEIVTDELPPSAVPTRLVKDESTATLEDSSSESRQKSAKSKEMYQDESSLEKMQNGVKDPDMSEELCRCENCDCFGLKIEFCKSGRFCSQSCVSSYASKKSAWLKRGAAKEKFKRKKLKTEPVEDNGIKKEVKCESTSPEPMDVKRDFYDIKKKEFCWEEYLKQENANSAPVKLFKEFQTYPNNGNGFVKGMKLEGIDHKHPSLFCVLSVMETRGYRVRLHFDGYSECYDFWVNADSTDIFPVGWCEKTGHQLQPPKGFTAQEFDWDSYLKMSKAEAAPKSLFSWRSQSPNPNFKRGMKLEAVDKKNSSLVCVATVTDILDNRFLIHFDGWEDVYDYWADASSPHLHHVNWCKENDVELTPPKDAKENVAFSWSKYLSETRSVVVPLRAFKPATPNEFKVGMKLEAVDRRNPILIRVATIADKNDHGLLIHFDGWSSVYDYWVDDNTADIHPINWCAKTGHPLEPPIVINPGQTGPCPTSGCLGQGHIKGPKYTSHHSAFGCPYSQINLNKLDNVGQDRVIITKESLNEFTKKISDQGGATDGLRRCPTPGCNGVGHVKGKYSVHHRVSGCPLAERNAQKVQQSSPPPTPSVAPPPVAASAVASTSTSNSDVKSVDIMKTRNGVGRGKKKFKLPGTGLRGRPPKHLTLMRLEAMKKAREANAKKQNLEAKVEESVFKAPFLTPPKELPLSWEHNTQLIPGLGSIKGTAVKQWSVNQVAKFVSSLKGCLDQGKLFREQLVDGESLLEMTQSDLIDILHLKLGPALKVFSSIIAFKESEKYE